jgi:hypothetical protein
MGNPMSTRRKPNNRVSPVQQRVEELNLAIAISGELDENHERRQGCRDDCQEQRQEDAHREGRMLRYFSTSDLVH